MKTLTEETKYKISQALTGKVRSEATKTKMSNSHLGQIKDEDIRKKISSSMSDYWFHKKLDNIYIEVFKSRLFQWLNSYINNPYETLRFLGNLINQMVKCYENDTEF